MLEHGGRLRQAAAQYGIPLADWLDLSTGLAPYAWPLQPVPAEVWQRLPEEQDGLEEAARAYYGADSILAVAGSQAAIQALPSLFAGKRVGIVEPCYAEHRHAWEAAGFVPESLGSEDVEAGLAHIDVLVVINPNNPTGRRFTVDQLLGWHSHLASRGGCLIVDEAFVDPTPEDSLAAHSHLPGLVVLRSLGKFFGLGGARLGFVLAAEPVCQALAERLGPWAVSGPTRYVGRLALADWKTQQDWRDRLAADGWRLAELLASRSLAPSGGCALFQWVQDAQSISIYESFARQGILTRLFAEQSALRIGLPADESGWKRLSLALQPVREFR
ncbi:L-threonine O-3-phosphate decarboxylase [Halopseudomonas xinjiangensis]|uniref:threonine-phosphate decarboxylase n=1 Tax=Halopseudomonas xinjiangensis TaxID=487184 RepID=A0A1H1S9F2_9GAMM|nr:threonine-phosphate decarboxylase CobD [Halopseudomonas xinjiangensis]SDS44594.1 L-threonine O-3-phosphate decarboxylase [Halopseudomonas xinjiangensis]